jgi:hypothetical protein
MAPHDADFYKALVNLACTPNLHHAASKLAQDYLSLARSSAKARAAHIRYVDPRHDWDDEQDLFGVRRNLNKAADQLIRAGIPEDAMNGLRLFIYSRA